jgi:glycosyltransferase involved in cell wall biosynthesis
VRVLHVLSTDTWRGAEIFASDLIRELNQSGVSQRVAALRGSGIRTSPFNARVDILSTGTVTKFLKIDVRALRALSRRIRTWSPDIVQAHGGDAFVYAMLASGARGERIVHRSIGTVHRRLGSGPGKALYGALLRRAATIVAVADAVRREAIETFGVSHAKVVTIPNAVDPRRLEPAGNREATRRALDIPMDCTVILSLGAIAWEKDPLSHVEVTARVLHDLPEVVHLIAGDGPMRRELEESIAQRGLEARVRVLGLRTDVADLLAASDVLLLASRSDGMEGMPANVIEAGMSGVPVVGYAVAGVAEVVTHGVTGFLTTPGDREGLAMSLLKILGDGELRNSFGLAARERCHARFAIGAVAPMYLDVYAGVVAR